jgi:hypothetical protein
MTREHSLLSTAHPAHGRDNYGYCYERRNKQHQEYGLHCRSVVSYFSRQPMNSVSLLLLYGFSGRKNGVEPLCLIRFLSKLPLRCRSFEHHKI